MNFINASGLFGERSANPGAINSAALGSLAGGTFAAGQAQDQSTWAKGMSDSVLASASSAAGRDFTLADDASANATDMWNRYRTQYQPVENQTVQDATQYDSPEQMERVRQAAAGNANSAFDTAQASRNVDLTRMGVNPNSGRFGDPTAMTLARTAGTADAMNRATQARQDTAIALRSGVVNQGTQVAQLGDQAHQIALSATSAATGATNAAGLAASGIRTQPATWTGASTGAFTGAAGDLNAQQNATTASTSAQNNARLGLLGGLGSMFSSKKAKHRVGRVIEGEVVKKIKTMPVDRWSYKPEILPDAAEDGAQREHIGPYAEDFKKRFGVGDGKTISVIDAIGVGFAAMKGMAKKIEHLEEARR